MTVREALIVIDLQNEFFEPQCLFSAKHIPSRIVLDNCILAIKQARINQHKVIWVSSSYSLERKPEPTKEGEDSLFDETFDCQHGNAKCCEPGSYNSQYHSRVKKLFDMEADSWTVKQSYSAFHHHAPLRDNLQKEGIQKITIIGVETDLSITYSCLQAKSLGYDVSVIEDCTSASTQEKHTQSIEKLRNSGVNILKLHFGAGDSFMYYNFLPLRGLEVMDAYQRARDNIPWKSVTHKGGQVPRLMAIQARIEDDKVPVYRHPMDELPDTQAFDDFTHLISEAAAQVVGHPLNHALIQYYRSPLDFIGPHSDKTLDMMPNTFVMNYSLGATRLLLLRPKEKGDLSGANNQRIELPANSLFVMGLRTNALFHHSIRQDGRLDSEKYEDELQCDSQRISWTLRCIGTFLDKSGELVGIGAKEKGSSGSSSSGDTNQKDEKKECEDLIAAFSRENREASFDRDEYYKGGFSVMNMAAINNK